MQYDAIIMDTQHDTAGWRTVLQDVDVGTLLLNPVDRESVSDMLAHSDNPLVVYGHGDPRGLYNMDWDGFVLDVRHADLLRQRLIVGIWCHAGEFADICELHGFFTSMFISNARESRALGFTATEDEVADELRIFNERMNSFLCSDDIPMEEWPRILQDECHRTIPFVRYNYEAIGYY